MRKLLLAFALLCSFTSAASAQCTGIFPANTACGVTTSGFPHPVPFATITAGASVIANNFSGSDIGAQINAAEASLPATGGVIDVLPNNYSGIATTISLSKRTYLRLNGSTLTFNAGVTGLKCLTAAQFSTVENGFLLGSDTSLGTNDGLVIQCSYFWGNMLQVGNQGNTSGFGRYSIAVLSGSVSSPINAIADNWLFSNVLARHSYSDSFHIEGADSNKGTCINCQAQTFGRYGFYDNSVEGNTYLSPNSDGTGSPTITSYQLIGGSTKVTNAQCETPGNTANATGIGIWFENDVVAPCVVTAPSNGIVMGPVGGTANASYMFLGTTTNAGAFNNGTIGGATAFSLFNPTSGFNLVIANTEAGNTAQRTLTFGINNANRNVSYNGDFSTGGTFTTTSTFNSGGAFSTAGAFTMSGAFGFTGTLTGTTNVTFPTSGTLIGDSGAWTVYTPTIVAQTPGGTPPTFTLTSNGNRSKTHGKTVFLEVDFTVTAAGTGTGYIKVSLPATSAVHNYTGTCYDYANTASQGTASITTGVSQTDLIIWRAAGTTFITTGSALVCGITYEIP